MTVSERMQRALEAYCDGMDDSGLRSLGNDVRRGGLAWFPDEFGAAISAGEFTPRRWEYFTNVALDDDDDAALDRYLRLVWSATAPDRPYPLDA
jgi:hypothetical protein